MHVSILATGPALAMALPATRFPCFHTSPRENSAADTEAELLPWGPAVRQSLKLRSPMFAWYQCTGGEKEEDSPRTGSPRERSQKLGGRAMARHNDGNPTLVYKDV
jgi:hypothetical protein